MVFFLIKIIKKIMSQEDIQQDNIEWKGFRLFFLGDNELDVEVSEVKQIDFDAVKRKLLAYPGNSVFITTVHGRN